jgi:hypothetical protein
LSNFCTLFFPLIQQIPLPLNAKESGTGLKPVRARALDKQSPPSNPTTHLMHGFMMVISFIQSGDHFRSEVTG